VSPGLGKLVITTVVLLLLNYLAPRQKVSTRYLAVQRAFSFVFLVLAAMTTFTLFVDRPLQKAGEEDRQSSALRVEEAFRRQYDAVGQDLAVEAMKNAVATLNAADKRHLAAFQKEVDSLREKSGLGTAEETQLRSLLANAFWKPYRARTVADLSSFLSRAVVDTRQEEDPPLPVERAVDHVPVTVDEWKQQRRLVEEQESKAQKAEVRKSENAAALKSLLSQTFAAAVPDYPGLTGATIENLSGEVTDRLTDKTIDWLADSSPTRWVRRKLDPSNLKPRIRTLTEQSRDTARHFLIPKQWDGYKWDSPTPPGPVPAADYLPSAVVEEMRRSLPDAKGIVEAMRIRGQPITEDEATAWVKKPKDLLNERIHAQTEIKDAER
jgi:hypothetical protein